MAADLGDAIGSMPAKTQRAVAAAAVRWALDAVAIDDSRVHSGREALSANAYGSTAERAAVRVLIDELDEEAWDRQGRNDLEGYSSCFDKARAANALWSALADDPTEAALDAVYEALMARNVDIAGLRLVVNSAL